MPHYAHHLPRNASSYGLAPLAHKPRGCRHISLEIEKASEIHKCISETLPISILALLVALLELYSRYWLLS